MGYFMDAGGFCLTDALLITPQKRKTKPMERYNAGTILQRLHIPGFAWQLGS